MTRAQHKYNPTAAEAAALPVLQQLVELYEQLLDLCERRPIWQYRPYPKQETVLNDPRRIVLAGGANRSGKSCLLHMRGVDTIEGMGRTAGIRGLERPPWLRRPDYEPGSMYIASADLGKLLSEPEQLGWYMEQAFPKGHPMGMPIRSTGAAKQLFWRWNLPGARPAVAAFMTDNMKIKKAAGGNPAQGIIDEETKKGFFQEFRMRLMARADSQLLIGATTFEENSDGPTWMYFDYIAPYDAARNDDPFVGVYMFDAYENPYLPLESIREFEKHLMTKDPEAVAARIHGDMTPRARAPVFDLSALRRNWQRREDAGVPTFHREIHYDVGMHKHSEPPKIQETPAASASLRMFRPPIAGLQYVIGADSARGGLKDDWHVAQVVCRENMEQVAIWRGHARDSLHFASVLAGLGMYYNVAVLAPELANEGYAVVENLVQLFSYPRIFRGFDSTVAGGRSGASNRLSYVPNVGTKYKIIEALATAIVSGELWVYDYTTLQELRMFERKLTEGRGGSHDAYAKVGAVRGMHDDCVIALAIAVYVALHDGMGMGFWKGLDARRLAQISADAAMKAGSSTHPIFGGRVGF